MVLELKKQMFFRYFIIVGLIALFSFGLLVFSFSRYEWYERAVHHGAMTYGNPEINYERRMRLWRMVLTLSSFVFFASPIVVAPIYYYFVKKRSKISNEQEQPLT